jgi:hypothetical protein
MQKVNLYKVHGAEIKREKSGGLIVGFSSQSILDSQLVELSSIKENFFLGFYCCSFYDCDLSSLKSDRVESIGIFHSAFGDKELRVLSHLSNINLIKLVDTSVTSKCISEIRQANGKIKIST